MQHTEEILQFSEELSLLCVFSDLHKCRQWPVAEKNLQKQKGEQFPDVVWIQK